MWWRTVFASGLTALILSGCGGDEGEPGERSPPGAATGAATATEMEHGTTGRQPKELALGARVWAKAGCGNCHTLAAAGSTGTTAPNLDEHFRAEHHEGALEDVMHQVRKGGNGMPSFEGRLTTDEIRAVAAFVVESVEKSRH